jgi:hypothetical protein
MYGMKPKNNLPTSISIINKSFGETKCSLFHEKGEVLKAERFVLMNSFRCWGRERSTEYGAVLGKKPIQTVKKT